MDEHTSDAQRRAEHATERAWARVATEHGLFTDEEAAGRLGVTSEHLTGLQEAGQVLAVRREKGYRYPGFQFAPDGQVAPAVIELISAAQAKDWSLESVTLWLCSPSGRMPQDRAPVEFLHESPGLVVTALRSTAEPTW